MVRFFVYEKLNCITINLFMPKPANTNYPGFFQRYISQVKEDDLATAFEKQMPAAAIFLESISEELSFRKYEEDKWTIKEVLQHMIDAERIFTYRAVCFARKDQNVLPSFDENGYALNSKANNRLWKDLVAEFIAVRKSTELLYKSFDEETLDAAGKASDYVISVSALGFVIVGHAEHHLRIIQERYIGV